MDDWSGPVGMILNISPLVVLAFAIGKWTGKLNISWWWLLIPALPFLFSLVIKQVNEEQVSMNGGSSSNSLMSRQTYLEECNKNHSSSVDVAAYCECTFQGFQSEDGTTLAEWTYAESNEERGNKVIRQCTEEHAL